MLEPRACARAVGMGLGVESSGGSGGLPPGFLFLLKVVGLGGLDLAPIIEHMSYKVKRDMSLLYVNGIIGTCVDSVVVLHRNSGRLLILTMI